MRLPSRAHVVLSGLSMAAALSACGPEPLETDGDPDGGRSLSRSAGWSCDGTIGKTINPAGRYFTTSFGCWIDDDGDHRGDPSDNCIPWCQGNAGQHDAQAEYNALCGGLSGPDCERKVKWYTAGADRWGCASRLQLTNPDNGRSVVAAVLDRGPHCSIERRVDHWVADLSYPTSNYLFGGPTSVNERADIIITEVPTDTPLGPVTGSAPPPQSDAGCTEILCDTDAPGREDGADCYCDASCTSMGDCCSNLDDVCGADDPSPAPAGCSANLCGTPTAAADESGGTCYCDADCVAYGDCCGNRLQVCDGGGGGSGGGGGGGGGPSLPSGPAGVQGVVFYGGSGSNRIPGATITLSTGHVISADASGYFSLQGLPIGVTTITASKAGWSTNSVTRTLRAGELTWGSVELD